MASAYSNAHKVAFDIAGLGAGTVSKVMATTLWHGAMLQTAVKRRAAGAPGPAIVTGNYNRSINRRQSVTATGVEVSVGTDAPQGARLEFGFKGTDSLGRKFNQAARPHFGPALDEIGPRFLAAITAATNPTGRG